MNKDFHQPGFGMVDWRMNLRAFGLRRLLVGTLLGAIAVTPASVRAANQMTPQPESTVTEDAVPAAESAEKPSTADAPKLEARQSAAGPGSFRAAVRAMVEQEVRKTGLPADIADAVVRVESNYDPTVIGGVGEIGLMQIRPETATMLGFRGSVEDLAKPEINIHYGVTYLSKAWRLANGDLCRALMKYRAGHGEEIMTSRSVSYCNRARNHLAALGSPLATGGTPAAVIIPASAPVSAAPTPTLSSPNDVYARYKRGTPLASRAFWAAHEARIRAMTAQIESRWHRVASR